MVVCKNCGKKISRTYCPYCGQKIEPRLTIRTVADDMLRGITNADRGVLRTLRELFTRPGRMIAEYIDGRRVIHFRPFPLLILLVGVFSIVDGLIEEWVLHRDVTDDELLGFTPLKILLFVPPFAFASWTMFRRRYNFIEHLYIIAFASIQWQIAMFVTMSIPRMVGFSDDGVAKLLQILAFLLTMFGLMVWSYKQIFGRGFRATLWRVIMIFVIGGIGIAVLSTFLVALIVAFAYALKDSWLGF